MFIFQQCSSTLEEIIHRSKSFIDWIKDAATNKDRLRATLVVRIKWCPPNSGWVKINTDGASNNDGNRSATAGVIRDSHGNWVAGSNQNKLKKVEKKLSDPLRIPLIKAPFWIQIHDIPTGFYSENLAIQLGNFLGEFMEYDGSSLGKENRNYMRIRVKIDVRRLLKRRKQILCYGRLSYMMLGMEVTEMDWDLSLRAQSRRAVPPSSVWLREEEIGQTRGNTEEKTIVETDARVGNSQMEKYGELIDPILGFNFEGMKAWEKQLEVNQRIDHSIVDMEQDKEEGFLIGEEGKKRTRGEMNSLIGEGGEKASVGRKFVEAEWKEFDIGAGTLMELKLIRRVLGEGCAWHGNRGFLWFVCGDFNEIMYGFEKKGGIPRDERRMEVFREVLADCGLMDVGFSAKWFTWERGNLPENNIRERLDRGVANKDWQNMFPDGSIQHLTHSIFDHCPLLVKTKREECGDKTSSFKFEAWWLLEETFDSEVRNIWESSSGNLLAKLNKLQFGLRSWASKIQRDRKRRKTFLNNRLSEILAEDRDEQNMAELIDTKVQLNLEIDKDERYWEQRARINWLKYGDKNTAFFHSQASSRRRKNMIQKMQSDNKQMAENIQDIENIAIAYFQNLFRTEERECCNYLWSGIKRCITEEDNQILMAPYTKKEIREATFGMGPTKAPGEDGFPAIF
ncbi:reverse transcriptase [Gossypium australe]|uniref:Reverse transcriptase n=1 Tax=Gossypium australe TaxID=47621 RepID=A0A5B6VUG8_9ROSI|nr:reverse transcriptase [Gossypium australe]